MGASPTAPPSPATSAEVIEAAAASSSNASPATIVEVISSAAAGSSNASPATTAEVISSVANSTAPYGNGTVTVTKYYGSGTGFLTLAKPIETVSADY
jgi:hypothetical protein